MLLNYRLLRQLGMLLPGFCASLRTCTTRRSAFLHLLVGPFITHRRTMGTYFLARLADLPCLWVLGTNRESTRQTRVMADFALEGGLLHLVRTTMLHAREAFIRAVHTWFDTRLVWHLRVSSP